MLYATTLYPGAKDFIAFDASSGKEVSEITLDGLLYRYAHILLIIVLVYVGSLGPGNVVNEKSSGALNLVFARPIHVWDYVFGKFLGVVGAPLLCTLGLLAVVFVLIWAKYLSFAQAATKFPILLCILSYALTVAVFMGFSCIAFSAVARSVRTASLMFSLYWIVPLVIVSRMSLLKAQLVVVFLSPYYALDALVLRFLNVGLAVAPQHILRSFTSNPVPLGYVFLALGIHACLLWFLLYRAFREGVR
jgi:ABC-type Na+ efflux pump permease subunit